MSLTQKVHIKLFVRTCKKDSFTTPGNLHIIDHMPPEDIIFVENTDDPNISHIVIQSDHRTVALAVPKPCYEELEERYITGINKWSEWEVGKARNITIRLDVIVNAFFTELEESEALDAREFDKNESAMFGVK